MGRASKQGCVLPALIKSAEAEDIWQDFPHHHVPVLGPEPAFMNSMIGSRLMRCVTLS